MLSSHRLYCLYSTEERPGGGPGTLIPPTSRPPADAGHPITPGEFLQRHGQPPPSNRMEDHFRRAARQMPVFLGDYAAEKLTLESDDQPTREQAQLSSQRLSAFRLPYGGLIFCQALDLDGNLASVVELLNRTTFQWRDIRLDGMDLAACAARIEAVGPELEHLELATDIHHLLAVDPDQIPIFIPPDGNGPARPEQEVDATRRCPDDVNPEAVEALIFRTTDPMRSSHAEVRYPHAANRRRDTLTAVGTAVTVIRSPERELEGWMLWSALQLTCCQARLRQVRRDTYDVLHEMEQEQGADSAEPDAGDRHARARARLADLSSRLGRLELELAFGVQAYLDVQFVLPSPMLAHCHRASASLMGLPAGTQMTSELLSSASKTVTARYAALGAAQRSLDDVRVRRITVAAGFLSTIALITGIFFGFFGANAGPVADDERSFLHTDFLGFYLALLGIIGLVGLLFLAVRRRYPLRD